MNAVGTYCGIKTDYLSNTERKVVTLKEEAASREITITVKLCVQKCADCNDYLL